ncbi:MAG: AI-2E family transporter [Phycisphaerales bacterium]|jgi:predicted PurR-regulated permease PerM|nr:AI-2E family transporter [Phycisphaerales bacterium]
MSQGPPERPFSELHLWEIRSVRDVLIVLLCLGLFWLGYAMRDVTIPLLVALLLAYLFEPAIAWAARTRWIPFGRIGAVSLLLTAITLVVIVGLALLVPRVVSQATDLVEDVQSGLVRQRLTSFVEDYVPEEYRTDAMALVAGLPSGHEVAEGSTTQPAAATASQVANSIKGTTVTDLADKATEAASGTSFDLVGFASSTGKMAWAAVAKAIGIGMLLFLIPFYFFFFSVSYPRVVAFFDGLLPERGRSTVVPLLERMDAAVAGFVRGRIVIAIIMAVLYAVGWMYVGVPYSILLAVVVGAFSLVPFLGLVGIPVAISLLALAQFDLPEAQRMTWWGVLLWPTLVFAVVNALDGWVLTPLIAGKATNLDPVTIFVAVLAGGSVMGAYGMLLAIPVAACIKILLSDQVIPKLKELGERPPAHEA